MKIHAQVVVIGGGIVGCSILYHLASMGWKDVVLLERAELTAGSTWHAAGNLFALTSPSNAQRLHLYSINLYSELEKQSGTAVGYHPVGGMHLAASRDEVVTLANARARARRNGIDAEWISLEEAKVRAPILNTTNLEAILWEPTKGYVDPSSATHAFAVAARKLGAKIYRHAAVTETHPTADGGWEITTPDNTFIADYVVNAAGLWGREVAALAGITLPLVPVEHHYLVTDDIAQIAEMDGELPNIGEGEAGYYSRQEGNGLLLGAYENRCHHWAIDGTPQDFGAELLPNDLERMEANFEVACDRMPCLAEAGVKRVINGPMIFSPDLGPLLGPHPALKNYFCANGVMTGFNQGGGIGKVVAEWIIEGEPSLDVNFWDVARFGSWAGKRFTFARTKYFYENRLERPYPHRECPAGRPARTFPVHDRQKSAGAVFGFNNGWEAPLWYARVSDEPRDIYSYQRQNWWETVGAECRNVRDNVGLFEVSTFAKHRVSGPGAQSWLNTLLAGRIPVQIGRTALCLMLSRKGRIIGDFTVSKIGEQDFLLLGAGTMQHPHRRWMTSHLPRSGVTLENHSSSWTGLMIAGPNARDVLSRLSDADVSNTGLPFLNARRLELDGAAQSIVVRVSFTGELGFEIYTPAHYQRPLWDALTGAGADFGLAPAGTRALMSLRLEKSFPSWGLELSPDYSPAEPGMDRFVNWNNTAFVGRDMALAARDAGPCERFSTFVVDADDADCTGGEPVFRDGEYVGYVTSGGYGYSVGESLALGYVFPQAFDDGAAVEIEINGDLRPARISARPRYDHDGARMRS